MNKNDIMELKLQPVGGIVSDLRSNRKIIIGIFGLIILYVVVSAVLFLWAENASKYRFFDSLYFTIISVTTVGFGDITPKTDFGKCIAITNAIVGLISFGFLVAAITAALQPSGFAGSISSSDKTPSDKPPHGGIDSFLSGLTALLKTAEDHTKVGDRVDRVETRDTVVNTRIHVRVRPGDSSAIKNMEVWLDVYMEANQANEESKSG